MQLYEPLSNVLQGKGTDFKHILRIHTDWLIQWKHRAALNYLPLAIFICGIAGVLARLTGFPHQTCFLCLVTALVCQSCCNRVQWTEWLINNWSLCLSSGFWEVQVQGSGSFSVWAKSISWFIKNRHFFCCILTWWKRWKISLYKERSLILAPFIRTYRPSQSLYPHDQLIFQRPTS